ncbi:hypothetical protein F7725_015952 [Dissostichus mawsoni]|uniref:Uncharacterized protein n=1 Tax=Dissostichus mawsoni TaxID=36200 RepID=A0A7J5Y385_DISMA|nr:hypothetical protein F7725_015952 [Dissostichus mawsoni]
MSCSEEAPGYSQFGLFGPSFSLMQLLRLAWALTAAAACSLILLILHNHILREAEEDHRPADGSLRLQERTDRRDDSRQTGLRRPGVRWLRVWTMKVVVSWSISRAGPARNQEAGSKPPRTAHLIASLGSKLNLRDAFLSGRTDAKPWLEEVRKDQKEGGNCHRRHKRDRGKGRKEPRGGREEGKEVYIKERGEGSEDINARNKNIYIF